MFCLFLNVAELHQNETYGNTADKRTLHYSKQNKNDSTEISRRLFMIHQTETIEKQPEEGEREGGREGGGNTTRDEILWLVDNYIFGLNGTNISNEKEKTIPIIPLSYICSKFNRFK